jgi:hypothetical protein
VAFGAGAEVGFANSPSSFRARPGVSAGSPAAAASSCRKSLLDQGQRPIGMNGVELDHARPNMNAIRS